MTPLAGNAPETLQGMEAFKRGIRREDNPYKWTPNSRAGDRKRASWEMGWDLECCAMVKNTTSAQTLPSM